jgi:two-component system phosphate regulon response regulator PhoB
MARILVIEDEPDLQRVLVYNLHLAGNVVTSALQGGEGLRLAQEQVPDLILLDLMLPDLAGTEICKALKAEEMTRHVPILILTAKGEEIDRVLGFELGADDYVTKPFSVRELLLRIQAILRRTQAAGPDACIHVGDLIIDPGAYRVRVKGSEV